MPLGGILGAEPESRRSFRKSGFLLKFLCFPNHTHVSTQFLYRSVGFFWKTTGGVTGSL